MSPGAGGTRGQRAARLLPLLLLPTLVEAQTPWTLSGDWRLRSEVLRDSFRLLAPASDTLLLSRLQLALDYRGERWRGTLEIQDSRAGSDETLTPLGSDDVNALEPIQLWLERRWQRGAGRLALRAGRMTVDFGSRRLLARNNFRNTSNAFQAALLRWEHERAQLQLLYSYPLQRVPDGTRRDDLRRNVPRLDQANDNERFAAITAELPLAGRWGEGVVEAYLFNAFRRGGGATPRAGRDLDTAGARVVAAPGDASLELEAAYQWGDSQASALPGTPWRRHRAWFMHAGFDWRVGNWPAGLTLGAVYDHASGDDDPGDRRNQRFDRLYGARAFELGPSGIFGVAIRSNLRSPALRLRWEREAWRWQASYRWLRLDSARDGLPSTGRRDASGASGRDLGAQLELRVRWRTPLPGLALEAGAAWLDKGSYFRGAPEAGPANPVANRVDDSVYLFSQLRWRF